MCAPTETTGWDSKGLAGSANPGDGEPNGVRRTSRDERSESRNKHCRPEAEARSEPRESSAPGAFEV
ncbi:hypothetical protein ACFQH2_06130 [Natronoarchaeum sp. GCM10025703]